MKKLLFTLAACTMLTGVLAGATSCSKKEAASSQATSAAASEAAASSAAAAAEDAEFALVTDVGDIDDESFNQTSWEAVVDYAKANSKKYAYYRPTEDSLDARVAAIKQAIAKGAKIIVCPGFLFETAVYDVQSKYPDVKFVLVDGEPHTEDYKTYKTEKNVVNLLYKEEIAGFLAGYATVKEGYRKLGFCGGMAVPAVQRYGSGYVQGIDKAAQELNVDVSVNYYYAGVFQATDAATAAMKTWYGAGTEVVFACGGKVYQSVVEGCKTKTDTKWIGVDVDQVNVDAGRVLTSACKGLYASVQSALEVYSGNKWTEIGGKTWNLGLNTTFGSVAAKDYVNIPTADASWKFTTYTKTENAELMSKIGAGTVTISNSVDAAPTVSAKTTVNYVSKF